MQEQGSSVLLINFCCVGDTDEMRPTLQQASTRKSNSIPAERGRESNPTAIRHDEHPHGDRPEPSVDTADDVKLQVLQVGICGTDREEAADELSDRETDTNRASVAARAY
jgi:hypothetical protein